MRVFSKSTLREFAWKHIDSSDALMSWYRSHEKSAYKDLQEIISAHPKSSMVGDNRIVFRIRGNNYRLVAKYNFRCQFCWIRFIGTHAEYDKINARTI
jgi:mRNA interferase HigB